MLVLTFLGSCAHAQPATTRATTAPATLRYLGCAKLPATARDQLDRPFAIHGASGIAYAGGDEYWAVLDNNDKLIRLRVKLADDSIASAIVIGGLTISDNRDNEGIAMTPGTRSAFVSDETTPAVHEYRLADGGRIRSLTTQDVYLRGHTVRNRGFESLALTPDGKTLWTANEHALTVDGTTQAPAEPFGSTTRVRLQRYNIDKNGNATLAEQFAYQTAGVHALGGFNSLADLVALPNGQLLALERSGGEALGGEKSIKTRVFLVTTEDATDVSKPPFDKALPPVGTPGPGERSRAATQALRFVAKRLLYEGFVCEPHGQNLEGLCLGPKLGENRWAVLGVVDDTDGPFKISRNYVVAFELELTTTGNAR